MTTKPKDGGARLAEIRKRVTAAVRFWEQGSLYDDAGFLLEHIEALEAKCALYAASLKQADGERDALKSRLGQVMSTCKDLGVEMHYDGFGRNVRADELQASLSTLRAEALEEAARHLENLELNLGDYYYDSMLSTNEAAREVRALLPAPQAEKREGEK